MNVLYQQRVEKTLSEFIDTNISPSRLRDAMRYAALNGGKRLRPSLVYATGEVFHAPNHVLDNAAAAIECIHTYSLIHDDLPAMDDDDLRRGKPTCHIAFDEATAILAGDALQTMAFELLARPQPTIEPLMQLQMLHTLALHAGGEGMIGGQSLDLLAEGKQVSIQELERIDLLKTGALIRASVRLGALGGGCTDSVVLGQLDQFATHLGLAFQLQDDLLDVIGNSATLGKNTQKDAAHHKATYVGMLGIENTQAKIQTLIADAIHALQSLPQESHLLRVFCDYVAARDC